MCLRSVHDVRFAVGLRARPASGCPTKYMMSLPGKFQPHRYGSQPTQPDRTAQRLLLLVDPSPAPPPLWELPPPAPPLRARIPRTHTISLAATRAAALVIPSPRAVTTTATLAAAALALVTAASPPPPRRRRRIRRRRRSLATAAPLAPPPRAAWVLCMKQFKVCRDRFRGCGRGFQGVSLPRCGAQVTSAASPRCVALEVCRARGVSRSRCVALEVCRARGVSCFTRLRTPWSSSDLGRDALVELEPRSRPSAPHWATGNAAARLVMQRRAW